MAVPLKGRCLPEATPLEPLKTPVSIELETHAEVTALPRSVVVIPVGFLIEGFCCVITVVL